MITDSKFITNAGTFTTSFGYDAMDRVLTTTYPTNEVVTQTYNAQGLLENLRSPTFGQWYASNLDYNANGSIALLKLGNNLTTNYTYFPTNFRLQSLKVGTLLSLTYKYDNIGNVMSITDTASFATPQYQRFTYDSLDRLITATVTGAITGTYNEAYAFNQIGNITNTTRLPNYKYGLKPHAVLTAGNNLYSYDGNGNMTFRIEVSGSQRITYTQGWDTENRLRVVTATNGVTTSVTQFVYDSDGNRVLQFLPDGSKTAYASALEISITGTQRITKTYYSAGATLVAMRVYSSATLSTLYFMYADHLGSASLTTDISGTVVAKQLYDAWGNVRYLNGSMPADVGYTGQPANADIKLVQMGGRWYDSQIGRWLSPDTIVPSQSNPQSLNRYAYVNNNPVKYTDPNGHEPCAPDHLIHCTFDQLADMLQYQFQQGGWNDAWEQTLTSYLPYLLQQSRTGSLLWNTLASNFNISIDFKSAGEFAKHGLNPDTATGTIAQTAATSFSIFLNKGLWQPKLAGNFFEQIVRMTSIVGHESFHIAIGDNNPAWDSVADDSGLINRGDSGMAYRIDNMIVNELLFGGDRSNYVNLDRLTGFYAIPGLPRPNLSTYLPAGSSEEIKFKYALAGYGLRAARGLKPIYRIDPRIILAAIDTRP